MRRISHSPNLVFSPKSGMMLGAGLGLWLATLLISGAQVRLYPNTGFLGITLTAEWQIFVLLGIVLGLLNFFVKPILDVITLPLKIITLGFFGILINMGLIWAVDAMFAELSVPWFWPLLLTSLIVWLATAVLSKLISKNED